MMELILVIGTPQRALQRSVPRRAATAPRTAESDPDPAQHTRPPAPITPEITTNTDPRPDHSVTE